MCTRVVQLLVAGPAFLQNVSGGSIEIVLDVYTFSFYKRVKKGYCTLLFNSHCLQRVGNIKLLCFFVAQRLNKVAVRKYITQQHLSLFFERGFDHLFFPPARIR